MRPENTIQSMSVYAANSSYKNPPSPAQTAAGVVPLDTLPADWWNRLLYDITSDFNNAAVSVQAIYDEILTVLTRANITPNQTQTDQLYNAIEKIRRTIATGSVPGSVISSTLSGKVQVDQDGVMTVTGLGTPTLLNTTSRDVVGAINEILATLTAYISTNDSAVAGKAPTNHASTATTYGTGNSTNYGHVKLSDSYNSNQDTNDGIAATPAAVKAVYDMIASIQAGSFNQMHPIGESYIQLPRTKTPNELWGQWSTWQEMGELDGAFFRAANCPTTLYSIDSATFYTDVELLNPINVTGAVTDTGNTEYNSRGQQVKIFSRTQTGKAGNFTPEGGTLSLQAEGTAVNGLNLNSKSDGTGTANTTHTTGSHNHPLRGKSSGSAGISNVYNMNAQNSIHGGNIALSESGYYRNYANNSAYPCMQADGDHAHNIYLHSTDTETRPVNYTIRVWKRIS